MENSVGINVSKEISDHFEAIRDKRDELLDPDNSYDPKEIVPILNAMTTVLKELAKIQVELHNSETMALFQQEVIDVLKELEPEKAEEVLCRISNL